MGGWRVQNKKPSVGEVWIFSGTAQNDIKHQSTRMQELSSLPNPHPSPLGNEKSRDSDWGFCFIWVWNCNHGQNC